MITIFILLILAFLIFIAYRAFIFRVKQIRSLKNTTDTTQLCSTERLIQQSIQTLELATLDKGYLLCITNDGEIDVMHMYGSTNLKYRIKELEKRNIDKKKMRKILKHLNPSLYKYVMHFYCKELRKTKTAKLAFIYLIHIDI